MGPIHRTILNAVMLVVRWPRLTLVTCGVVLMASIFLAYLHLSISTDTNKLVRPTLPFFHDYLTFIDKFPENEAVYVTLQARDEERPPTVMEWAAASDDIATRLQALKGFVRSVQNRVPSEQLGTQGLVFDTPANVQRAAREVVKTDAEGHGYVDLLKLWGQKPDLLTSFLGPTPTERYLKGLALAKPDIDSVRLTRLIADSWLYAMSHPAEPLAVGKGIPRLADLENDAPGTDPSRLGYYYTVDARDAFSKGPQRHLLLIRVYPVQTFDSLAAVSAPQDAIRAAVDAAKPQWNKLFKISVTGRPVLEADELTISDRDTQRAEILAACTVFVGLVLMLTPWNRVGRGEGVRPLLGGLWLALAAEISLGVGVGWTFGWATISTRQLNLLSLVFVVALIGIGMDYLIQVLTRYRQEAARHQTAEAIWWHVFEYVSAPISTACLGASGAFLVSVLTKFDGAAELGIIAGGGLLLCLLTGYTVLPALLTLFPVRFPAASDQVGKPVQRKGVWLLIGPMIWIGLLCTGAPLALRTTFSSDLLGLQAEGLESVQMVHSLPTWYAVVMSKDIETLRPLRERLRGNPEIASTESLLDAIDNRDWLLAKKSLNILHAVAWTDPTGPAGHKLGDWSKAAFGLAKVWRNSTLFNDPDNGRILRNAVDSLESVAAAWQANFDNPVAAQRMAQWQVGFIQQLRDAAAQFSPPALDLTHLPAEFKDHFVSDDGTYALYIYPSKDLWNPANQKAFVDVVESEAARDGLVPTGIAIQLFRSVETIRGAFLNATLFALVLIVLLVLIDLRSIAQTLLAISVLALGLPVLLAVMQLLHIQWNFANFFGLPILIGAGHEYGVFMVHRYREAKSDRKRVWRRWDTSDFALLLCAFVTSSSFAYLTIAEHRGIRSLGQVMAMGIACIYLATVAVVRPLLLWLLARSDRTTLLRSK